MSEMARPTALRRRVSSQGGNGERLLIVLLLLFVTASMLLALPRLALPALSRHMAQHIVLMSVAAPALALEVERRGWWREIRARTLLPATLVQLAVLFAWHLPATLDAAHASPVLHVVMQITLLTDAAWFWSAVLAQVRADRWRAILALLLTGKLFCLIGAALTFAPRDLYGLVRDHASGHGGGLEDQQLAGLMMLAACPLTYALAGVVIAVRWLDELAQEDH